jgi:uncharacterized protein YijF (DUF1287 family)
MKNYRITTLYSVLSLLSTNALADNFESKLVYAAIERTTKSVTYDGSYISISYPNGDRKLGIDLQKLLHEDIAANFDKYPSKRIWGLNRPDKNIDHRRVPNLQTFLSRQGTSLAISKTPSDYKPGDIVTWMLGGNLPHIGIVTDQEAADGTPMIVHNIGSGPQHENMLFSYTITGHYRFMPN